MRETTRLLCDYVCFDLAILIESYIIPGDTEGGLKAIYELFKAGHWELCSGFFNEYYSSHSGLSGAIDGNSIELVRVMAELNTEYLTHYIAFACAKKCDTSIIELLLSYGNEIRNGKRLKREKIAANVV